MPADCLNCFQLQTLAENKEGSRVITPQGEIHHRHITQHFCLDLPLQVWHNFLPHTRRASRKDRRLLHILMDPLREEDVFLLKEQLSWKWKFSFVTLCGVQKVNFERMSLSRYKVNKDWSCQATKSPQKHSNGIIKVANITLAQHSEFAKFIRLIRLVNS